MVEIDVRAEIDEFRFADGEPGGNTVYLQQDYGIVVVNGENKGEAEVNIGDIDNLIEALRRAKDAYPISVTSKEEAKKYGRYSTVIDTIYFDNEICPWTMEVTSGEFSDWIRHDGGKCPVHPKDIIEVVEGLEGSKSFGAAGDFEWGSYLWSDKITHYRHKKDEDGLPYISNEGLEPWAEYVASDEDGEAWQFESRPFAEEHGEWFGECKFTVAPHHNNTFQNWTETLRRVWRK